MKKQVTLLLILLPFVSIGAQNSPLTLSLKESEQYFTEHNVALIAERYNIDMADARVTQAKLFENPVVSYEQNVYNRINNRYFDFGRDGEMTLEVEQLIYIAGQRNKRVRLEKINKEIAVTQFEEVLRSLRSELKENFIELYYARQSEAIYDCQIRSLSQILEIYRDQQQKGNVSLLEKTRIQALLLSLQKERDEIADRIIFLQGEMKLLLGLPNDRQFEPLFDETVLDRIELSSVPFSELESRMQERPDIQMAANSIKASEADIRLQKSLAFPEVSIKGAYDKAGNFIDDYWAIGLNVSLPLFNRNQGNIKAAKLAALQNSRKEEYLKQSAYNELFAGYARLEKAIRLYHTSNNDLLRDFTTIMDGVNENFRKRNISLLEFVDYYESYKETSLQLYRIREELMLALENMNTVVGSDVFSY